MSAMQSHVKRRYDATKRKQAAAANRRAILDAALELFSTRGYTATSMAAIAARADVALDTVYASVGRKPELARLLIETAISGTTQAVSAEDRDYVQAIRAAPDAGTKIDIYASAMRVIAGRLAPVLAILQQAASAAPELTVLWREVSERRATNMHRFVEDLAASLPCAPIPARPPTSCGPPTRRNSTSCSSASAAGLRNGTSGFSPTPGAGSCSQLESPGRSRSGRCSEINRVCGVSQVLA